MKKKQKNVTIWKCKQWTKFDDVTKNKRWNFKDATIGESINRW
jgi:hypothetical protein